MAGPLPHLLVPLVLVTFQDRAETRVRTSGEEAPAADFVDTATVELAVSGRGTRVSLGYAPAVTVYDVGTNEMELALYQTLNADLTYTFRRGFVSLRQSVGVGRQNLRAALSPLADAEATDDPTSQLGGAAGPASGAASQGPVFDQVSFVGTTSTTLTLGQQLSRRFTLSEYGEYSVSGGLDAVSRDLYPTTRRQTVGIGGTYASTSRDNFSSGASAQVAKTSGAIAILDDGTATSEQVDATILTGRGGWDHAFSRLTTGSLQLGATYSVESVDGDVQAASWNPLAELSLDTGWTSGATESTFGVATGYATTTDSFTGRLDQRVYGTLSLRQQRRRLSWFIAGTGTASVSNDRDDALTLASAAAGTSYEFEEDFSVDAGATVSVQLFGGQDVPPAVWAGTLSLTYSPSAWRF